jgi:hypothetical protein
MDWKQTLAALAPTVARALGGPFAGAAVSAVTAALGIEPTEDALAGAITAGNPEIFAKIKAADQQFDRDMKALDIDLERVHAGDRDSARTLAANTTIRPQVILATIYVGGFVAILFVLFSGEIEIPQSMRDPAMLVLGALIAGNEQIRNFFFGSSSGSKEKNASIERIAKS